MITNSCGEVHYKKQNNKETKNIIGFFSAAPSMVDDILLF